MAHSLFLLDVNGTPQTTINSQVVNGRLAGWRSLTFTPSGAAVDSVPQNSVAIPLTDYRNAAVGQGTQLQVWDDDLNDEVTRGPVLNIEDSVDEAGVHWATVTFADALYDLSRADVTSSFAADIGYTNHGAGDPIPSRPAETLTNLLLRLVGLADTAWTVYNSVAGFDGLAFGATGSIAQALDNLRQARFCHFRRQLLNGSPRSLVFADLGTPFVAFGLPVWAVAPGPNPTAAASAPTAPFRLPMHQPKFSRKTEVVNSLTPKGQGNGTSALTLRILYGNTSFTGYNPLHPIQRRPTQSGATSDGFDYFIEDAASIAQFGRTRQPLPVPDVGVTVSPDGTTQPVDETSAAVSLYLVADASLRRMAQPVTELSFTTPGVADVRNTGGMTIHVQYDGEAFDKTNRAYQYLALDTDFFVLSVVRAVADDGTAMDTWTVTTSQQALSSGVGTLLGVMDTVTAMNAAVQTYPMSKPRPKSQNIGPDADLTIEIFADNSMVRRHWALMYLTLEGLVHTRADNGHTQDVITGPMNHDVNALPHDVGNNGGLGIAVWDDTGEHVVTTGEGYEYQPDPHVSLNRQSTKPATAKPVYFDGTAWYWDGSSTVVAGVAGRNISFGVIPPTSGGTGGKVKATTGASSGTGQVGGSVPKNTHTVKAGYGAALTVATEESVYRGPSPTGVTVWVDNVQRFGPFNTSPGVLDLTPYVSDQNAHTVTVKSSTNGAADVFIDVRDDVAAIAVRPTG